jgi:hypothetical protein
MGDVKEHFCNGLCHHVFVMTGRCFTTSYRTLPMWEVTRVAKYSIDGLGGGGGDIKWPDYQGSSGWCCVQLWLTCPDVPVGCGVDALLIRYPRSSLSAQCRLCCIYREFCRHLVSLVLGCLWQDEGEQRNLEVIGINLRVQDAFAMKGSDSWWSTRLYHHWIDSWKSWLFQ